MKPADLSRELERLTVEASVTRSSLAELRGRLSEVRAMLGRIRAAISGAEETKSSAEGTPPGEPAQEERSP